MTKHNGNPLQIHVMKYLQKSGKSFQNFAKMCDTCPSQISGIVSGERIPSGMLYSRLIVEAEFDPQVIKDMAEYHKTGKRGTIDNSQETWLSTQKSKSFSRKRKI